MSSSRIVLVDLDGTIADLDASVESRFRQKYPEKTWIPRTESEYDKSIEHETREILNEPFLFENLTPIPYAIESVKEMENCGHHVFFCTSPLRQYDPCVTEKFKWIEKHFGKQSTRRIIITKDKTIVHGNYLIDDRRQTGVNLVPTWIHIVYNQPCNQDLHGPRMFTWKDWKKLIL